MKKGIQFKMGMRTIKTGIAVAISITLSFLVHSKSPFFAGIGAILAMQSSVSESFIMGKNRMLGTFLGAFIGLLFSLVFPQNPLFIGIGIIIVIHLCYLLGWKKSVQISGIVFLAITLNNTEDTRLNYAIFRIIDTFIGIIVSMIVNYFILPPNMEEKIKSSIQHMYMDSRIIIDNLIWRQKEVDLVDLKKEMKILEDNYTTLRQDIELNLCKTKECFGFQQMLFMFENIYNNISIIAQIEKYPYIDEENKAILEKLYPKIIPCRENIEKENIDIVYNYHLNQILEKLLTINKILGEDLNPTAERL
jgi:uncharacterized membrane protein YgaE (UPF0421/DUF939 family)